MNWIVVLQKAKAIAAVVAPIAGVAILHVFETITGVTLTPEQKVALVTWITSIVSGIMVYAVPNAPGPVLPETPAMKALQ